MAPCHRCFLLISAALSAVVGAPLVAADEPHQTTDSWYTIEFDGQRVGYEWVQTSSPPTDTHTSVSGRNAPQLLKRQRRTQLRLQRAGAQLSLAAVLLTLETPAGIIHSWELTRTSADGSRISRRGTWDDSRRAMRIEDPDNSDQPPLFAESDSQPYSPIFTEWLGNTTDNDVPRTVPVLFPESAVSANVKLQSAGSTTLPRPDGSRMSARRLLWEPVSARQLKTTVFVDTTNGRCLIVEQPLLGGTLRLERTTPEVALGLKSQQAMDLQLQTLLPVTGQMPEMTSEVSVRLKLTSSSPSPYSLADTEFQRIESHPTDGIIVTCRLPLWPETQQTVPNTRRLSAADHAEYLLASKWIDHTEPAVRRLLNAAGGRSGTPAEICRQLSAFVNQRLQFSAFTTQLQPASRVAATLRGDCTEHTVLLCSLLRSRGIPARAASGFAFVPQLTAFAPHLWTEAFVDGVWMPLDSTIPAEAVSPLLLKVADSPLNNDLSGGVALFAPLLPLCGQVEITVLPEN
ncbi:MAG: transglutaminase-like domain-containing protein [Planctomycetaceae bacterium]